MKLIGAPFCSPQQFSEAFDVLEEAHIKEPVYGLDRPFYAPGGYYGACWWSLDYALAIEGVKWSDFSAARDLVHNLRRTQCEDGRVKLYGADSFGHIPNVKEPVASLPKYFETACSVAVMSGDRDLCREALALIEDSLEWWRRNRLDEETGLYSAVFEESFLPNTDSASGVYAPIDTNLQVAIGMENAALLMEKAKIEGKKGIKWYRNEAEKVRRSIDLYLWSDQKGAFFPCILPEKRHSPVLMGNTFMGFAATGPERGDILEALLRDDAVFGWDTHPINSVAKTDPTFTVVTGDYQGNPSWSGSIWTLINEQAVRALKKAGRRDTACELAVKTAAEFAGNYAEFLHPFTLSGEGVHRYAWSAAQCVRLIVEEIFGLSYNGFTKALTADPMSCKMLDNVTMTLQDIPLPDGRTASAVWQNGSVTVSVL